MSSTSTSSDLVVLRQGISVTAVALRLLWDLEDRRLVIKSDAGGHLLIGPQTNLTSDDRLAVRAHKGELVGLVKTCNQLVT